MSPAFDAQAAFERLMHRLDSMDSSQQEIKEVLIQTVTIQTSLLETQQLMQLDVRQVQQDVQQVQQDVRQLQGSQLDLLRTQKQMLDYMKFTFDEQAKWNERQDQFNSIMLDEVREVKLDLREIKKKVFGEVEARLIKLEDFMNDQLRKAS